MNPSHGAEKLQRTPVIIHVLFKRACSHGCLKSPGPRNSLGFFSLSLLIYAARDPCLDSKSVKHRFAGESQDFLCGKPTLKRESQQMPKIDSAVKKRLLIQ